MQNFGILGKGFLGGFLIRHPDFSPSSWYTNRIENSADAHQIFLDLCEKNSPERLPSESAILIFLIPPVFKKPDEEIKRLRRWCLQMQNKRPCFKKMIYISSVSVYPASENTKSELSSAVPDTEKGKIRLVTEKIFSEFFDLKIIRPGGIYGPGRNLLKKILENQPIQINENRLISRIHVWDLARLIFYCARNWNSFPKICNAVDEKPETRRNIIKRFKKTGLFSQLPEIDPQPEINRALLNISPVRRDGIESHTNFEPVYPDYFSGLLSCKIEEEMNKMKLGGGTLRL